MNAAPIYINREEKIEGPFDYDKIFSMLGYGEIEDETLSRIEGMTNWRSVTETMVWSQAVFLEPILEVAKDVSARIAANKLDVRYGRGELRKALTQKNILTAEIDMLGIVVEVNAWLERMRGEFVRADYPAAFEYYPTQELFFMQQQAFPRDWPKVWQEAGGKIYSGKMIARKDDPVWLAVSDFGFPFPPFSFDKAAWIKDVSITEAEKLGVPDLARKYSPIQIKPLKFVGLPSR